MKDVNNWFSILNRIIITEAESNTHYQVKRITVQGISYRQNSILQELGQIDHILENLSEMQNCGRNEISIKFVSYWNLFDSLQNVLKMISLSHTTSAVVAVMKLPVAIISLSQQLEQQVTDGGLYLYLRHQQSLEQMLWLILKTRSTSIQN